MTNKKKKGETKLRDLTGVGPAVEEKLIENGYSNLMKIATAPVGEIIGATGITELTARKIINEARKKVDIGFTDAAKVEEKRKDTLKLKTGSKAFDKMMGGGFESRAITECYGEFGSSKTQIAHQLAVNVQLEPIKGICAYIDSEGSFRAERIRQMAKKAGIDGEKALKGIRYLRAYNTDHQMLAISEVEKMLNDGVNIKLLVVDSLMSLFRGEYIGRGTLSDRQGKLNLHMHSLIKLADIYNIVVYVTNQVLADPSMMFGDPTKPIGGHILGHNSIFRIYLRKGKKGSRVAKLVDAPNLEDSEVVFRVVEGGIIDEKEG